MCVCESNCNLQMLKMDTREFPQSLDSTSESASGDMLSGLASGTGPCDSPFDTKTFKIVAILRASAGLLSFFSCALVILMIVCWGKYKFFTQRLILYLAISVGLHSLAHIVGRVDFDNSRPIEDPYCYFAGFLEAYARWVELLSICSMTVNLFAMTVIKVNTERFELVYLLVPFVLPLLWCWVPFLKNSYGTAGPWCGIRVTNGNCETHVFGHAIRFIIWHVPLLVIFFLILVASLVIVVKLHKDVDRWEGTLDPRARKKKQSVTKEVKTHLCYPAVYLLLSIPLLLSEIHDWIEPHNPELPFWILCVVISPFAGTIIALAYALDPDTRWRLKRSLVTLGRYCQNGTNKSKMDVANYSVAVMTMFGDSLDGTALRTAYTRMQRQASRDSATSAQNIEGNNE